MPSGKRARQQRQETAAALRTPPPVRSKGVGGIRTRQASPRALAIAGGVVLIVIVAIVVGVVLSSGGSGGGGSGIVSSSDMQGLPATGSQTWPGALQGAGAANDLFKGIPQKGLTLGKPNAPVTMEMFIDVQCPFCQDYEINNLPTVVTKYIREGKVQLHLKPWAFLGGSGSQSFSGRLGLIAASSQNKGFEYAKVLYDNQGAEESGWLDGKMMAAIGASVTGLKMARWQANTNSSAPKAIASQVDALATTRKVVGTPTVFVGPTGGKLSNVGTPGTEPTLQETEQAIDATLANS
ncbi:MAG TPA: thioredoxin domain-containing protein [Gaiellaceae bacterium]|jgi:protein-disulfide isomerase|nr:thioredoxin domain-containing protein [Gaiellaceae bacterium]